MATPVPADDLPGAIAVPANDLPEGYQPPSKAVIERTAGKLGKKVAASVQQVLATRDPDVDYTGVPDNAAQAAYSLISKPEDRITYLKQKYGEHNVTKDSFGRDVVIQEGKKVSFEGIEGGPKWGSVAGDVLPIAGMIVGDIAGGGSTPTGMALAGIGGAAGTGANKLIATGLGLPSTQGMGETVSDLGMSGLQGMGLSGLGRGTSMLFKTLLGPYGRGAVLGPWPRTMAEDEKRLALLHQAQNMGLRPNIGTYQPRAKIPGAVQQAGYQTFGTDLPAANRPILERGATALETKVGDVPSSLQDTDTLNTRLTQNVEASVRSAEMAASQAKAQAESILILKGARKQVSSLSENVANTILGSRESFGTKASEMYKPIDDFAGGPVGPTATIKEELNRIMNEMPPTKSGGVSVLVPENLQSFAKGINDLPDMVTLQQLQAIRHKFYSKAEMGALNSGLSDRQAIRLAQATDRAFDDAVQAFTKRAQSALVDAQGKPITTATAVPESQDVKGAVLALRRADQFYKAGIKRFHDLSVEALVKDATQTGFVEPEKIAKNIAIPGLVNRLLRVKKVVSSDVFNQIGEARWKQIVQDSTDPITGELSGTRLTRNVRALERADESGRSVFNELYGNRAAIIRQRVSDVVAKERELDAVMRQTWVKSIREDGPESLRAADWLTKPENRLDLRKALQTFGKDSTEGKALLSYGARKMFSAMEVNATMGAEQVAPKELMGEPLVKMLETYGTDYLNEFYGKEWTHEAFKFAKIAEFATRKNPAISGIVGSALYKLAPFTHKIPLLKTFLGAEYLSNPLVIRYLGEGIRGSRVDVVADMIRAGTIGYGQNKMENSKDIARTGAYRAKTLGERLGQ